MSTDWSSNLPPFHLQVGRCSEVGWKIHTLHNVRFTLADPMPRLASDVVGGKSGRNRPTSRRDPIHIGRMARNVYIRVGWYQWESCNIVRLPGWYGEGILFTTTLSCVVHDRLPIGRERRAILNMFNIARRPPDEAPTADSGSGTHSHWPSRQHRGVGSVNVKRA